MEIKTNSLAASIKICESQIESALADFEMQEKLEPALDVYLTEKAKLEALEPEPNHPQYPMHQRVLAYCLMRTANILRQLERGAEAAELTEREIIAARNSGDEITLGRSLMSHGTTTILSGDVQKGLKLIGEALACFEKGDSYDHVQGQGWVWVLRADLINAGLLEVDPEEVKRAANRALALLLPIKNWPGVARAYAARAVAHENLGDQEAANTDREKQAMYAQIPKEIQVTQ